MAKTLRYFELDSDEGYFLADAAMLEAAGLTEPEALRVAFGDKGRLITITLHTATQRLQRQIVRDTTEMQPDGSLREDVTRVPEVRALTLIEKWEDLLFTTRGRLGATEHETVTVPRVVDPQMLGDLAPLLANTLDDALRAHLFPNVFSNQAFTTALQSKSKPSAQVAN